MALHGEELSVVVVHFVRHNSYAVEVCLLWRNSPVVVVVDLVCRICSALCLVQSYRRGPPILKWRPAGIDA